MLMGKSEVSLYDLPYGTSRFIVRQIGYAGSEMTLDIHIPDNSWLKWVYILVVLFVLSIGLYAFRTRLLEFVWIILRKLNGMKGIELKEDIKEVAEKAVTEVTDAQELTILKEPSSKPLDNAAEKKGDIISDDKYRTNKVSPEECKRLYRLLEQEMKRNKPYRNPNLKIADLAESIGTTSHSLSYLFNQFLEKNYYDYINEYRVEEFKSLIRKEQYAKYTLSALAELCGFSSRASFFRSFKKSMGITPNEYIKQVSDGHHPVT